MIRPILHDIRVQDGKITDSLKKRLENFNLEIVNMKNISQIEHLSSVYKHTFKRYRMKVFQKGEYYYISVKTPKIYLLLKDDNSDVRSSRILLLSLFAITLILLFSYLSIIRKLYPLKLLQDKTKEFGKGDFDIECKIDGKDEIATLSNEFNKSIKNLNRLKNSRNIFLRNIMHELKTPITKGRFLAKLPKDEKSAEKLDRVFLRLETLINEFASVEKFISSCEKIDKKEYFLSDIVDNALDLLFEFESSVDIENLCEEKKVIVNFKLFSIAIKNLMDNAIKYSSDGKAIVRIEENQIVFKNRGEKLKYPFQRYLEPFFKESENSKESFGLGLYITQNILQTHNLALEYIYKSGQNIFYIKI